MEEPKFESWAIVEVMGHKRFAGHVTEQAFGSESMLRIDVPEIEGVPAFSKLIGIGSIYAITPCTEQTAAKPKRAFACGRSRCSSSPCCRRRTSARKNGTANEKTGLKIRWTTTKGNQ